MWGGRTEERKKRERQDYMWGKKWPWAMFIWLLGFPIMDKVKLTVLFFYSYIEFVPIPHPYTDETTHLSIELRSCSQYSVDLKHI